MTRTLRFVLAPIALFACRGETSPVVQAPAVELTRLPAASASVASAPPAPCAPSPAPPAPDVAAPVANPDARFYPGADNARHSKPWKRYPTAVLLFAPPRAQDSEPTLARIDKLSFQPVLCTVNGALQTGVKCGEAMPARATVRITSTSTGDDTLVVSRATTAFTTSTEDGPVTMPAPYAPACCMYKLCRGRTIPYRPSESARFAYATTKTILAVWPEDADIGLKPATPETDDPAKRAWKLDSFARKFFELATSDIDHDGRPEIFVYEAWANDYGFDVFVNGAQKPAYAFSCGNI